MQKIVTLVANIWVDDDWMAAGGVPFVLAY